MKMTNLTVVPREELKKDTKKIAESDSKAEVESAEETDKQNEKEVAVMEEEKNVKPDFMIPLSFQSDMGHIHQKAGFTVVGE